MIKFLKSVGHEMKLVTWPTAKQNRHDTAIVVGTSILFAVYLGALDLLFSSLTQIVM
ncbi:preprotein translocase subunit SecE [Lactobacillus sp. ESL0684]|uniref:preprotein translocase subunit SecE n=1 Tax=unclassified Lactobacillus TaxID=2620435 RepID=UPI0023F691B2|nr:MULTISPECIES: preprotein translocase subunit SecE [unclassified Lactobacillus]WEV41045.1 preprotein translocase subunit SecE [Lactobacillus sp. ESL0681]WEV44124.1 preprotein translocase subunit SecE [Lactobacillus sp. ESL0684]